MLDFVAAIMEFLPVLMSTVAARRAALAAVFAIAALAEHHVERGGGHIHLEVLQVQHSGAARRDPPAFVGAPFGVGCGV